MHRQGHFGIALLGLAPVLYVLLARGYPFIALFACGVIVIEPLPDNDFWVPGLTHRGISHTFLTASIIGALCAGFGWVLGTHITVPVANWLIATILIDPTVIAWVKTHLALLDATSLALVGFCVGSGGICLHLLGDMLTVQGITPFVPFSGRKVSLSSLRAKNPSANRALFVGGVLAIVAVGVFLTPLGDLLMSVLGDMWQSMQNR